MLGEEALNVNMILDYDSVTAWTCLKNMVCSTSAGCQNSSKAKISY